MLATANSSMGVILSASPLFDRSFYASQYRPAIDGLDPLDHYLRYGTRHRLDPNLYFDAEFYARCYGEEIGDVDLLWHYITIGEREGYRPSAFFSPEWYAANLTADQVENGILAHYLSIGCMLELSPHPLFDVAYYRSQLSRGSTLRQDYFAHYLREGYRTGMSPHPLFHVGHYWDQIKERMTVAPLVHYLTCGWIEDLSPHPLFDPVHYRRTTRTLGRQCPLVHYLVDDAPGDEPHYLFSDSFYSAQAQLAPRTPGRPYDANRVPLVHYVRRRDQLQVATHPLFDPSLYAVERKRLKIETAVDRVPLIDYVRQGWQLGARPHRIFNIEFYLRQVGEIGMDPVRHYLTEGGFRTTSPNPGFDQEFYLRNAMEFDLSVPPLIHLMTTPAEQRKKPHAFFDLDYYRGSNSDIASLCPILHFLSYGIFEGRRPNQWFSADYFYTRRPRDPFVKQSATEAYFTSGLPRTKRVLFVSHDATLTGAPGIILRLLEDFTRLDNVECFIILDRGGERLADFAQAGHVHVMSRSIWEVGEGHESTRTEVVGLLELLQDNPPIVALVNSAETRHIGGVLHRAGIPVITLIHEFADFYSDDPGCFERIYAFSQKVVFPAQFVLARADALASLPDDLAVVRGQGLLRDDFGEMQRSVARRRVIEELKLANDTFIVMACGTIDQRKGVDYFVTVALRFLGTVDGPRPACFVWVGGGARSNTSPYAYAMVEIRSAGCERQILFVDQRPDVEQFYVASDVFLLTARADPFPCVVHEAMASRLPVIAFEDAGGAPELIGSKAGFCVPFGDTHAMCDHLVELYKNEERRAQIGAAAQQIIKEQWTASRYFLFMLDLVATVTGLRAEEFGNPSEERVPASHRVFFLNADWGLSGVNTFSENLVEELNRRGFQAEILFTRGRFSYLYSIDDELVTPRVPARYIQPQGVRHPVGHLLTTPNAIWASLERFLLREQPCVVIPNYDYVASAISPVLPDGVAVVGIAHSDHREHYEHVYRLGRFWNRIVAVSSRIADQVVEDNPGFSPRLVTIPYGVPSADLTAAEIEQNKAKPREPLSLLYAGRFEVEQKNILDYVKLARQLLADGRRFTLTMCGDGSQHAAVMASLRGLTKAGLAEVTGRLSQAELAARLDSADVFLLLSDYEGLSLGMLEAMARGCIPIVTDMKSGVPETIKDGVNGFIVKSGDLAMISDRIAWLTANPEGRLAMAVAAHYTLAERRLRLQDMGEAYAALIEEIFQEMGVDGGFRRPHPGNRIDRLHAILPPPDTHSVETPGEIWGKQLLPASIARIG